MTDRRDKKPATKTPKNGARYVAARGVQDVLEKMLPLDQALSNQALFTQLETRDRGFARLIAATTLRRMGQIDQVLAPFIKKAPPTYVLAVLRTGAAQILFLGTPPHAAVSAGVALLKRSQKTARAAGMANAVLRRVSEQGQTLLAETRPLDNLPKWLRVSWEDAYGAQAARAIANAMVQDPPLDITVKSDPQGWAEKLEGELLPFGTVRRSKIGDVTALAGFDDGEWWAQDISASLPVKLAGDLKGKKVLDLCAAPGGKTMQLAAAGAIVTAIDKNEDRLARVHENLKRTKLSADVIVADVAKWRDPENKTGGGYDVVILDAPCSATGTFRRRPDVLHLKSPADVSSLMRVQEKLLLAASRHVRPGGTLIYCTCSLETREGEQQIIKFMKNRANFRLNAIVEEEMFSLSEAITPQGCVRVLPSFLQENGGMDGFFIARFTRC
ncbi:MAG: MFS transporter [Robiginitomaculum sp.]|nr:MAG: MFS transporter [Robiginitomaculum sp.]